VYNKPAYIPIQKQLKKELLQLQRAYKDDEMIKLASESKDTKG
jgi:hypothetical protein